MIPGTLSYTVQVFFMAAVFVGIGIFLVWLFSTGGGPYAIGAAIVLFVVAVFLVFLGIRSIRMMMAGGPVEQYQMPPGGYNQTSTVGYTQMQSGGNSPGQQPSYYPQQPPPRF